jgi:hypothetical protein
MLALTNGPTRAPEREVEISGEHVAGAAFLVPVAFTRTAAAADTAVPRTAAVAIVASRIVPVPHGQSPRGPAIVSSASECDGRSSSAIVPNRITAGNASSGALGCSARFGAGSSSFLTPAAEAIEEIHPGRIGSHCGVTQNLSKTARLAFASWNHLAGWLRRLESLWRAA